MKKIFTALLTSILIFSAFALSACGNDEQDVLRIYSCEDYISQDEDTGATMADDFADWYNETYGANIRVEYSTFGTNEIMYNRLKIAPNSYDLVCPSDYMIQKMINENMLEEYSDKFLDKNNPGSHYCKNVSGYVSDLFASKTLENGKSWNNYAAGYMWGTMGYIYNPQKVDENDVKHWSAIWQQKYNNQSTLKDSIRDTYFLGLAYVYKDELNSLAAQFEQTKTQLKNKLDGGMISLEIYERELKNSLANYNDKITVILNRTDDETLKKVEKALKEAKNNIFGFEVDSGKSDMITGKININFAWSGDAVFAIDEAESQGIELYYSVPEEGSNVWFDAWVMPKGANKTLAEAFVNYISQPQKAIENMDYIGYTSVIAGDEVFDRTVDTFELSTEPTDGYTAVDLSYFFTDLSDGRNAVVYTETLGRQFSTQYPDKPTVDRCVIMSYFPRDIEAKVNEMWENVRGAEFPWWVVILIALLIGAFAATKLLSKYQGRKKPKQYKDCKIISRGK